MTKKLYIYSSIKLPEALPDFVELRQYPKNKKILLISPHSDDISVSCGGTISVIAGFNKIIPVLLFTGYRGVEGKKRAEAIEMREREMKKEAKILGIESPVFLRLPSYQRGNTHGKEDILKVEKVLVEQNPDIIFLPRKNDLQPRHKLANQIVSAALKTFHLRKRTGKDFPRLFFYENPWSLFGAFEFNAVVILSKKDMTNKLRAIRVHVSQLKRTPFDKAAKSLAEFRGAVVPEQRIFGYGKCKDTISKFYIESFKLYGNNH